MHLDLLSKLLPNQRGTSNISPLSTFNWTKNTCSILRVSPRLHQKLWRHSGKRACVFCITTHVWVGQQNLWSWKDEFLKSICFMSDSWKLCSRFWFAWVSLGLMCHARVSIDIDDIVPRRDSGWSDWAYETFGCHVFSMWPKDLCT